MRVEQIIDEGINLLLQLFFNRKDTFGIQHNDGSYHRINKEITRQIIYDHLKGKHTMGTYQLNKEEKVKWFCIDIDEHFTKDITIENMFEPSPQLKETINRLISRFKHFELPMSLEFSGRRGYHLWGFINQPIPAYIIQSVCEGIVNEAIEELHKSITIEIFPKQIHLTSQNSYGNLVKLPMGIHQVINQRSYFCDTEFKPYQDKQNKLLWAQIYHLENVKFIGPKDMEELSREFCNNEFSAPEQFSSYSNNDPELIEKPIEAIFKNCAKIKELWDKAVATNTLAYEEHRNIASIFAHIPDGDKAIHDFISHCKGYQGNGNYNESITQKHIENIRKHLKPITCAQLCGCNNIKKRGKGGSPIAFSKNNLKN
jgi:hypothetical protein